MTVRDDGTGCVVSNDHTPNVFGAQEDLPLVSFGGNGIGNMYNRTSELNGRFDIISEENQGTQISISFKV
jgi:signal transduction histidine kinase